MKKPIFVFLFLTAAMAFVFESNARQVSGSQLLKSTGMIRVLYTAPHPRKLDKTVVFVQLKGRIDRDVCNDLYLKEHDDAGFKLLTLSMEMNRRVVIDFEGSSQSLSENKCEIQSVRLMNL